ncbi:uncharacterized protein [Equus przewalskii]|uniref:Uncharacterized protein isoform X1 n=1 Tax=Equus przewalskii TaxID=9798 RepID=A0ABM4KAZ0_EQUPR
MPERFACTIVSDGVRVTISKSPASRQNRECPSALSARSHLSHPQRGLHQQINKGNASAGWQWLGRRGEQAQHGLWRCRPRSPRPSLFQKLLFQDQTQFKEYESGGKFGFRRYGIC